MCCIIALCYKLLPKCQKRKEEIEEDKLYELFVIEEHIDQKMIELINDAHRWKNR